MQVSARSSVHSAAFDVEAALPVPPPLPHLWSSAVEAASPELPLRRTGLCALLAATARRHPDRIALIDGADKAAWSGRPAMTLTYATAAEVVARLARGLHTWRLAPGSRVGLFLPASIEGLLAHLAVEAAGHVPCLLPITWDEDGLAAGIQAAGVAAVLSQARLGSARPAEMLCRVAAGYFGLRYLAAFGPGVPDGVLNLDELVLDRGGGPVAADTGGGLVTFAGADPARPILRPGDGLLAAVAVHLVAARVGPGERILSLAAGHDLRGLVTGLGAALVAGASLETLPVFRSADLAAALARPVRTHLVVPAFLEEGLASHLRPADCPKSVVSLVVLHRAPANLTGRRLRPGLGRGPAASPAVLDVLALDEDAVLTCVRGADDLALTLADPARLVLPPHLLDLRRAEDGRFAIRGQAARCALLQRGGERFPGIADWRMSGYRPVLFAGTAVAVEAA